MTEPSDPIPSPAEKPQAQRPIRKPWYRRYFSWLSLVAIMVVGYMLFFSDSSLGTRIAQERAIDSLSAEISKCRDTALHYRELNSRLSSDPEEMERIVREHHNMNHPNEDVYLFEKNPSPGSRQSSSVSK